MEIRIIISEELIYIPKKFHSCMLNAKKQFLLILRHLINAKIEALEKKEEKTRRKKKG